MKLKNSIFVLSLLFTALGFAGPSIQTQASSGQQGLSQSLSEYDKKIIGNYTGRGYFMNTILSSSIDARYVPGLRGVMFPTVDPDISSDPYATIVYQYGMQLNRALDKIPSYRNGSKNLVYRGVYTTSERPEDRYPEGKIWIERRYTSTTTNREVAKAFAMGRLKNEGCGGCPSADVQNPKVQHAILIEIESLDGKKVKEWSIKKDEEEVLFKVGTIFKVERAARDERGRYAVKMKELKWGTMTEVEKASLDQYENQRTQAKIHEAFGENKEDLNSAIEKWNVLHETWIQQDILNQEIDFSFMDEGG